MHTNTTYTEVLQLLNSLFKMRPMLNTKLRRVIFAYNQTYFVIVQANYCTHKQSVRPEHINYSKTYQVHQHDKQEPPSPPASSTSFP